jgi:hypothetical protein
MEFREANKDLLRGFRRSMLRYAADLNGKIAGLTHAEFGEDQILHRHADRSRNG